MSHDRAAWTEIRCAYETGDETVAEIAARYGVSAGSIYRHARRENWARRSKPHKRRTSAGSRKGKAKKAEPRRPAKPVRQTPPDTNLIERLYQAMDAKLKQLEARMEADQEISPADSERETERAGLDDPQF